MSCGRIGLLHSRSKQRLKILVNVCPDDIFWTTGHFVTKPGIVTQHHKPECHAEKLVHCVQCQGHSEGLYDQNMTIIIISSKLLVCLQAGVSCGKIELLHLRSRSQWRFKMSVNICPDDIFWIAEHFVTKFGMVMQHHEPESHADFFFFSYLHSRDHNEGSYDQIMTLSTIFSEL